MAADPLPGATLSQVEETGLPVVVDTTDAAFCASCILGQLMEAARRFTRIGTGPLVIASEQCAVVPLLTLLGLDEFLADLPTALTRFGVPERAMGDAIP